MVAIENGRYIKGLCLVATKKGRYRQGLFFNAKLFQNYQPNNIIEPMILPFFFVTKYNILDMSHMNTCPTYMKTCLCFRFLINI